MPEARGRTAAEREAARRERANRRARREGRPEPYPEPAAEPEIAPAAADELWAAEPEPPAAEPERPAAQAKRAIAQPERPAAEPKRPAAEPKPPAAQPEPPAAEPEPPAAQPEPPAAATEPPPAQSDRPIKSFPSPPDPDFYVADDQLETPSGTRRVSRGSRVHAGGRGRATRARRSRAHRPHGPGRRWLGRIVALIMLLVAAAVIWFAIELFQPFGVSPHGHVTVRIPAHTSSSTVARMLASDGVIASRFFFEARATLDGDRSDIRAGTYHLQRGMSYEAVLAKLTAIPKQAPTSNVTISEGHTRQYVAKLLHSQHIAGNYLADTRRSTVLDPRHYGAPKSTGSLEGFLFPDTFQLRHPVKVSALVADQLKDFKRRFATIPMAGARRRHQSAFDVITIASLIEAESASPHDDRLVSSVIENRLRDHMMLQLDSTARYATGNFTGALTQRQLDSKSPYNTHTHYGLPPGPIDSPGLTALRAAAEPATSSYLYFFSKPCTHATVFAKSYAEFELLLIRDRRLHCPK